MKKLAAFLAALLTLFPVFALAASPTIIDSLPVTGQTEGGTRATATYTYNMPAGNNRVFVFMLGLQNSYAGLAVTLNGGTVVMRKAIPTGTATHYTDYYVGMMVATTTGNATLSVHTTSNLLGDFFYYTVKDAAQTTEPDDFEETGTAGGATTVSTNATTTAGNDLLLSYSFVQATGLSLTYGAGETATVTTISDVTLAVLVGGAWKAAGSSPTTETMTTNTAAGAFIDQAVVAIKYLAPASTAVASRPLSRAFWWGL